MLSNFLSLGRVIAIVALLFNFTSCSLKSIRLPASFEPTTKYNPQRIKQLKSAADNGVLFLINDAALRDVDKDEVDSKCRRLGDPEWSEKLFAYLEVFEKFPAFYKRVHVIEIKKSDAPKISIDKDLDGLTYLTIAYNKVETREKIREVTRLPCDSQAKDFLDKDITHVQLQWPEKNLIAPLLSNQPERPIVERFNFDRQFLSFLAERNVILKYNQELGFDKTPDGRYALPEVLARLGQEFNQPMAMANLNYWFSEISKKSSQASSLQFFGIMKDLDLSYGVKVETEGEFARKILGHQDPTYIYTSFRTEAGNYFIPKLAELEDCLAQLTDLMAGSFSSRRPASEERNSFLRPGFSCKDKNKN